MEQTSNLIKGKRNSIQGLEKEIEFLEKHQAALDDGTLPTISTGYQGLRFDFYFTNREDTMKIVKYFGGSWEKSIGDMGIHYQRTLEDGTIIRCYNTEPPPCCIVEEYDELVPAQMTDAYIAKRKRIICPEPSVASLSDETSESTSVTVEAAGSASNDVGAVSSTPPRRWFNPL